MDTTRSVALMAMLALAAAGANAQSQKIRQVQARQEAELAKDVERTNKTCASGLEVKFDWRAVPADALEKFSAEGYCDALLEGVRRICVDQPGRNAVKEQIKRIVCGFGSERAISLKDGALDYKINFNSVNDSDFVYAYLTNNL